MPEKMNFPIENRSFVKFDPVTLRSVIILCKFILIAGTIAE